MGRKIIYIANLSIIYNNILVSAVVKVVRLTPDQPNW